jgi:hypothetical protein
MFIEPNNITNTLRSVRSETLVNEVENVLVLERDVKFPQ